MKRCRFSALAAGLILSGSLCLSGCSVGLKDAYSLKERVPSIEASFAAEDEAAKGFASDLCVISDELTHLNHEEDDTRFIFCAVSSSVPVRW